MFLLKADVRKHHDFFFRKAQLPANGLSALRHDHPVRHGRLSSSLLAKHDIAIIIQIIRYH
jgi:hypothetical protein